MKVAVTDNRCHVRNVMIGLIAMDITMAITRRVMGKRFLKLNRSNSQPMAYPGETNINEKSKKASVELNKSCRVKLTMNDSLSMRAERK